MFNTSDDFFQNKIKIVKRQKNQIKKFNFHTLYIQIFNKKRRNRIEIKYL